MSYARLPDRGERIPVDSGSGTSFELELSNEFAKVRIKRVETHNGARVKIHSPRLQGSIELDAIALESLTWQTMETFSRLLSAPDRPRYPGDERLGQHAVVRHGHASDREARGPLESGSAAPFESVLSNEYATVYVRKVDTLLEISSPRLQHSVQLDPIALESLTWQTMETFSQFLETPFGPEED